MKTASVEIEVILRNAIANLSLPIPNTEKSKRGIGVALKKLLELAENRSRRDPLLEAKYNLAACLAWNGGDPIHRR